MTNTLIIFTNKSKIRVKFVILAVCYQLKQLKKAN